MKEYCVDLEIAKELKENGFPQKTEYYWNLYQGKFQLLNPSYAEDEWMFKEVDYSAPTTDEILKELPAKLNKKELQLIKGSKDSFMVIYEYGTENLPGQLDKKPCNALAKMWLYLKKEGYIK